MFIDDNILLSDGNINAGGDTSGVLASGAWRVLGEAGIQPLPNSAVSVQAITEGPRRSGV